jgi:uncharacterized membrane protein
VAIQHFAPMKRAPLLMLGVAFALRVFLLEAQGLWGDEAFSLYVAKQHLAYIISGGTDVHPPLYHLLLRLWIQLAGDSVFAVRFLSVAWSMLIIAAAFSLSNWLLVISHWRPRHNQLPTTHYQFPLTHFPSRITNYLLLLLLALSPFHIFYAQETRMYAQVAALATLSLLFFARLQTPTRTGLVAPIAYRGALTPWFISTLLALYTQYFAFFSLAAQNIFVWRHWRADHANVRRWIMAQLALALCYAPWAIAQMGYLSHRANTRTHTLSIGGVYEVITKTLGALFIGATIEGSQQIFTALLALLFASVGYFAMRRSPFALLLLLCIVTPIGGALIANPLLPYFRERFMLLASPPFIILIAHGLAFLMTQARWMVFQRMREREETLERTVRVSQWLSLAFVAPLILGAFIALTNYWFDPHYRKGAYDLAIADLRAHAQPSDAIIVYSPMQDALYDYYRVRALKTYVLPNDDLAVVAANHSRAWLILYGDPAAYDSTHQAELFLSQRGFKSFYQSYKDGALARYDFAPHNTPVTNLQAQFGDAIVLTGFTLPSTLTRGSTLPITLQWQTRQQLAENYTVFAHVLDAANKVVAQMDTQPVGGTRPTQSWQVGETIHDNLGVAIPKELPEGRYRVEVGLYLLRTGQRLPISQAGNLPVLHEALILGEAQIR